MTHRINLLQKRRQIREQTNREQHFRVKAELSIDDYSAQADKNNNKMFNIFKRKASARSSLRLHTRAQIVELLPPTFLL